MEPSESPWYTKGNSGKFLFIRHGETNYNIEARNYGNKHIQTNWKYINCDWNTKGIEQVKAAAPGFEALTIEKVYASPLSRSLQTAYYLFETHPQKDSIIIVILPILTEILSSVHNYAFDIDYYKTIYNMQSKVRFDWKEFDEQTQNWQWKDLYFYDYINTLNKEVKSKEWERWSKCYTDFLTNAAGDAGKNKEEHRIQLRKNWALWSRFWKDNGILRIETWGHAYKRMKEFKQYLKQKHEWTAGNADDKVVVISHSAMCKWGTSRMVEKMFPIWDYPDDCYSLKNCEIISMVI